jgi:hypothetical protein
MDQGACRVADGQGHGVAAEREASHGMAEGEPFLLPPQEMWPSRARDRTKMAAVRVRVVFFIGWVL